VGLKKQRRAIAGLLLGAVLAKAASAASGIDPQIVEVAHEARRVVAIIDDFYRTNRACPRPSLAAELEQLQSDLGDGFSADRQGFFVEIRGISMISGPWRYYASPRHPDRCTLWHSLGQDAVLVWRRHRYGANWMFNGGDGKPERPIQPAP
jgi:hypothetical protein